MNLDPENYAKEPRAYDSTINPMDKRAEYEAALSAGREPVVPSGDFWHWLGETYPAQPAGAGTSGAAEPAASGNHGWDSIVDKINAETRQSRDGGVKPAAGGNHGWDEIVSKMNSQIRR